MKKIILDEIIVVEGKDDITNLSRVLKANFFNLNGSSGLSLKKIEVLKELSKNNKILLVTDPDFTGKKIRNRINEILKENIENIYISRKKATSPSGNVGVENISTKYIYEIFNDYLLNKNNLNKVTSNYIYTIDDFLTYGLTGNKDSKIKRELLGDILKIGYYNSKALLNILNAMKLPYSKYLEAIEDINLKKEKKYKSGIIFGKFIPVHKGHINFIKEVSKEVDKLYVCICFEKKRDRNLLENSTLPKFITEKDRRNFLNYELQKYKNIQVIELREEGIDFYPNGWFDWSKRVVETLKAQEILITDVYTNELQDVENYKKYFKDNRVFSKDLIVNVIDPKRFEYSISSTKIRNEYEKYKNYLPKIIIDFFEK